jgi:signal transduction histidine kinase
MRQPEFVYGYRGGYLIGFIMIAVVALRASLFFLGDTNFGIVLGLLVLYTLFYCAEPWLSDRFSWYLKIYFPVQTLVVIALSQMHPFPDFHSILYFPLCIQLFRAFSVRVALGWTIVLIVLLGVTLVSGMGLWEGLALIILELAMGTFLISYDFLYRQTQSAQRESQQLLSDLKAAHEKLQEQSAQAEELAAARERNRLARELHDSVSQTIFSITLTSQSARLLLERDPLRAGEQIERLQVMTSSALNQLRSLIAQLHSR